MFPQQTKQRRHRRRRRVDDRSLLSRIGSTGSAGADGRRTRTRSTPIDSKWSSLPWSGIEPKGTTESSGSRPAYANGLAQLGHGVGDALAADRDPSVAVLGDVLEQLRSGCAADEDRRPLRCTGFGHGHVGGEVRRTRRRSWPRPGSTARAWRGRARGRWRGACGSRRRGRSSRPRSSRSRRRARSGRPEMRSSVAAAFAVTIGSRCATQQDAGADPESSAPPSPRP